MRTGSRLVGEVMVTLIIRYTGSRNIAHLISTRTGRAQWRFHECVHMCLGARHIDLPVRA